MFPAPLVNMTIYAEIPGRLVEIKRIPRGVGTVAYGAFAESNGAMSELFGLPVPFLLDMTSEAYCCIRLLHSILRVGFVVVAAQAAPYSYRTMNIRLSGYFVMAGVTCGCALNNGLLVKGLSYERRRADGLSVGFPGLQYVAFRTHGRISHMKIIFFIPIRYLHIISFQVRPSEDIQCHVKYMFTLFCCGDVDPVDAES